MDQDLEMIALNLDQDARSRKMRYWTTIVHFSIDLSLISDCVFVGSACL